MNIKLTCALTLSLVAATGTATAAVVSYSQNFSSGAGSIAGWVYGGGGGGGVVYNTDTDDGALPDGAGDGTLRLDSGDSTPGNEIFTYNLSGTMEKSSLYTLSGYVFNGNLSHNNSYFVELYNVNDATSLAISASLGASAGSSSVAFADLEYKAQLSDVGDTLQIRFTESWDSQGRDGFIDTLSLTVSPVPEPSSLAMIGVASLIISALRRRRLPTPTA